MYGGQPALGLLRQRGAHQGTVVSRESVHLILRAVVARRRRNLPSGIGLTLVHRRPPPTPLAARLRRPPLPSRDLEPQEATLESASRIVSRPPRREQVARQVGEPQNPQVLAFLRLDVTGKVPPNISFTHKTWVFRSKTSTWLMYKASTQTFMPRRHSRLDRRSRRATSRCLFTAAAMPSRKSRLCYCVLKVQRATTVNLRTRASVIRNISKEWLIKFVEAEYRPSDGEQQSSHDEHQSSRSRAAPLLRLRRRDRRLERINSYVGNIPLQSV
ncbi:hypothetical protein GQ53DRAFT_82385 [Thozetella sp. PMI_491]|nr:hypothetical protein GQ53DRAFT_82385 [Thozetella sp. PMI_491]